MSDSQSDLFRSAQSLSCFLRCIWHTLHERGLMRLDRYIADSALITRSEATKAIRGGRVTVDGKSARDPSAKIDEKSANICLDGVKLGYTEFRYIMLNKPADTVSTTEENDPKSVMNLLPQEMRRLDMFPCGRLDIDTVGLLIITNDGQTAHALLSPKHHCEKTYRFECLPLPDGAKELLERGIELKDFTSKPCTVSLDDETHGEITVTEGKYHQIKRMFHAVDSEITFLERVTFGGIELDRTLARGQWRDLTAEETALLLSQTK